MVNQLLAGVHIASAAEGIAFGARLGLNTRVLYDIIMQSSGASWYVFVTTVDVACRFLCQLEQ
jgi:3-hydroxyisobutyrate dehydrogenase-like beta-hydroxyacid dehydrogenase